MAAETFAWNPVKHFLPGYLMIYNQEATMLVSDIPGWVSGSRRKSSALSPETTAFPSSGALPWFANCMKGASPSPVPALVQFNF